jgi:hypothetical protein
MDKNTVIANDECYLKNVTKKLDEIFNVNEISENPLDGKASRTENLKYTIPTSVIPEVEALTKLFDFFKEDNDAKRVVAKIECADSNNVVFEIL